jgi:hypothetical protein
MLSLTEKSGLITDVKLNEKNHEGLEIGVLIEISTGKWHLPEEVQPYCDTMSQTHSTKPCHVGRVTGTTFF